MAVDLADLIKRVEKLEKRPDIFDLDPESNWIIVVPEDTPPGDVDKLEDAIQRYPNATVIVADNIKGLRIS